MKLNKSTSLSVEFVYCRLLTSDVILSFLGPYKMQVKQLYATR